MNRLFLAALVRETGRRRPGALASLRPVVELPAESRPTFVRTLPSLVALWSLAGFYLSLGGSLRGAFGVCGNGNVPADGHVVHAEYGCGGHSELQVDTGSVVMVAELVYDDGVEMDPVPATD